MSIEDNDEYVTHAYTRMVDGGHGKGGLLGASVGLCASAGSTYTLPVPYRNIPTGAQPLLIVY